MTLRLVGAGLPRTGTKSLQLAIERLLGARCYHMTEVFEHLDHVPIRRGALRGEQPMWDPCLDDYVAAVDWPASAFWEELCEANPEAPVVLSVRGDPLTWWRSADMTILGIARRDEYPEYADWLPLSHDLLGARIGEHWDDAATAMAAYERHNDAVRAAVLPERLVEWRPADGWTPICKALDVPVPEESFPHVNTTEEWIRGREVAAVQ